MREYRTCGIRSCPPPARMDDPLDMPTTRSHVSLPAQTMNCLHGHLNRTEFRHIDRLRRVDLCHPSDKGHPSLPSSMYRHLPVSHPWTRTSTVDASGNNQHSNMFKHCCKPFSLEESTRSFSDPAAPRPDTCQSGRNVQTIHESPVCNSIRVPLNC